MKSIAGYQLLKKLGEGGAGIVWKATKDGEFFAIKVLRPGADSVQRARFEQEAEWLLELGHRHLVRALEYGVEDGHQYLVLEFVDGRPIAPLEGPPPESATQHGDALVRLIRQFEQTALALDYLHQSKIVHRDVKPANILIDESGDVRLVDLGVARVVTAETMTLDGELLGTAFYLSPEQAMGSGRSEVDARSDIYSLGVSLYYCLTGRHPFEGETYAEILQAILLGKFPPPQELVPSLSGDLQNIILKCLERDPRHRYSTARELADELRRFRSHQAIRTRGVSPIRRGVKFLKTRAAVLLGVVLAAVLLWDFWLGRQLLRQDWAEFEFAWSGGADHLEITPDPRNWKPIPGFTRERLSKRDTLFAQPSRWYRVTDPESGRFATIPLIQMDSPQVIPLSLGTGEPGPGGYRPMPGDLGVDVRVDPVTVGEIRPFLEYARSIPNVAEKAAWDQLASLPDDALVDNVSFRAAAILAASLSCRTLMREEYLALWEAACGSTWGDAALRRRIKSLLETKDVFGFHLATESSGDGSFLYPEDEPGTSLSARSVCSRAFRMTEGLLRRNNRLVTMPDPAGGILLLVRERR